MREKIKEKIKEARTLTEVRDGLMEIFKGLKNSGSTIIYVSGAVTADGPEHIERNLKQLAEHTEQIKDLTGVQAFSSGDVFDGKLFSQLEECKLPHEQANELFYQFWNEIVGCGLIDMVCLTPGWERSRGAKEEYQTACKCGIKVFVFEKFVKRKNMSIVERIGVGVENVVMKMVPFYYALLIKPKYFWRGEPDEEVVDFASMVKSTRVEVDKMADHWRVKCKFDGEERATGVFRHNGLDQGKPTIIWHHGAGNSNYEWQMRHFLNQEMLDRFNIFSIKAAHHQSRKDYLANCMDSFVHWQMTFAGSVLAEEEVVKYCREYKAGKIIVTGVSMGGIVASWHWLMFNTANYYLPIVGYPNVGEIFMGNGYKGAIDRREARLKNPGYFQAFVSKPRAGKNITAILGGLDKIVTLDQSLVYWHGHDHVVYPDGHATIALRAEDIRKRIIQVIQ